MKMIDCLYNVHCLKILGLKRLSPQCNRSSLTRWVRVLSRVALQMIRFESIYNVDCGVMRISFESITCVDLRVNQVRVHTITCEDFRGSVSRYGGARNQVGVGLSYRPASLCSLATQFQFLESIPRSIAGLKFPTQVRTYNMYGLYGNQIRV